MEDVNEQEVETEAVNVRLLGHEKPNTITFTRVPAQGPDLDSLRCVLYQLSNNSQHALPIEKLIKVRLSGRLICQ